MSAGLHYQLGFAVTMVPRFRLEQPHGLRSEDWFPAAAPSWCLGRLWKFEEMRLS